MPGRHQQVFVYPSYDGGTDLWCSGAWNERGSWWQVFHTRRPKQEWWLTWPRQWRYRCWYFVPNEGAQGLTEAERMHVDSEEYRELYGPSLPAA